MEARDAELLLWDVNCVSPHPPPPLPRLMGAPDTLPQRAPGGKSFQASSCLGGHMTFESP